MENLLLVTAILNVNFALILLLSVLLVPTASTEIDLYHVFVYLDIMTIKTQQKIVINAQKIAKYGKYIKIKYTK